MTTANTIIARALGLLGVKDPQESVSGNEAAASLLRLNALLDAWRLDSLTAYMLSRVTASVSTATATIGPAGTFVLSPRPERLEMGCFFSFGGTDLPIVPIDAERYNSIAVKTVTGYGPQVVYFDGNYPTGTLYFYPVPASAVSVTLLVQTQLTAFADLTTDYSLPPGYERALGYMLALELAPEYEIEPSPTLTRTANGALRAVKRVNSRVPVLQLPSIVTGPIYGAYWY